MPDINPKMTISEEAIDLAEHIAIECGCSMPTCISWVVTSWIQSALDRAYNQALEDAAKVVEPEYEFEVFAKRRQKYADSSEARNEGSEANRRPLLYGNVALHNGQRRLGERKTYRRRDYPIRPRPRL